MTAMYSHAACIGVTVFLLFCAGAFGVPGWSVNFSPKNKCAPLGSSVDIGCSYKYPSGYEVGKTLWKINGTLVDFSSTPHQGRRTYLGDKNNDCTLRITNVKYSDAGEYIFRFETDKSGAWSSKAAFTLSVAALLVVMSPAQVTEGQSVTLTCSTTCPLSTNPTYTWSTPVTSQHTTRGNTLTLASVSERDRGSYSCALTGLENHPSLSVCVLGCLSVTYSSQRMCAVKGSSVDMGCSYSYPNYLKVKEMFWHRSQHREDLSKEAKYKDRVKLKNKTNECGLQIESVRESDSGQYQFRFTTSDPPQKMSGNPGVTLLVSSLQVMMSSAAVREGGTVSLTCNSTCPANNITYIWFQNRKPLTKHTSDLILDSVKSDDSGNYSCAVEGNENHPSSEVTLSVQYSPRNTSAWVSPSGNIAEGSSVNLTCSSDANPPVHNYTWYKSSGNELIFKGKGTHLTLTVSSGDGGVYYCQALNEVGSQNTMVEVNLTAGATSFLIAVGVLLAVIITVVTGIVCFRRKRRTSKDHTRRQTSDDREMSMHREGMQDTEQQGDSSPLYDNISAVPRTSDQDQRLDSGDQDDVAYASVQFKAKNKDGVPDSGKEDSVNVLSPSSGASIAEDYAVIYSTINKPRC